MLAVEDWRLKSFGRMLNSEGKEYSEFDGQKMAHFEGRSGWLMDAKGYRLEANIKRLQKKSLRQAADILRGAKYML